MDLAQAHGVKVIYSVKQFYWGNTGCGPEVKSEADEEPAVRRRVREFRDHPAALLAWYLNDELPQTFMPRLEAHQRWVAEDDPNHPTWAVLYQVNEVNEYRNTFDVIGTDPYPLGVFPLRGRGRDRRDLPASRAGTAQWQVPQLHNWANYPELASDRNATRPRTTKSAAWPGSASPKGLRGWCSTRGTT